MHATKFLSVNTVTSTALLAMNLLGIPSLACADTLHPFVEKRCGWLINDELYSSFLLDRGGKWVLVAPDKQELKPGYVALGSDKVDKAMIGTDGKGWNVTWKRSWFLTGGITGFGCVCLHAVVDHRLKIVEQVEKVYPIPLERCNGDPRLPSPPNLPIIPWTSP